VPDIKDLMKQRAAIELSGLPEGPVLVPLLTELVQLVKERSKEAHELAIQHAKNGLKIEEASVVAAFGNPSSLLFFYVHESVKARVAGDEKTAAAYEKGIELVKLTLETVQDSDLDISAASNGKTKQRPSYSHDE
jgi:hypothetical protein